jgi:fucokinase
MPVSHEKATFCGMKWKVFLELSGIYEEDLWDAHTVSTAAQYMYVALCNSFLQEEKKKNLMNAKMFPVFCATKPITLIEYLWLQSPSTTNNNSRGILERWRSSWRMSLVEVLSFVNLPEELAHRR